MLGGSDPLVMGVLNITPDSFSDGGELFQGRARRDAILAKANSMIAAGAAILDIGGESTRPGAARPSEQEEIERVLPVIEWLRAETDISLSVDTSSAQLMQISIAAGAHMINDVRALGEPGALKALADVDVPVCLMHMKGRPGTMQDAPLYADVVDEVLQFLLQRIEVCAAVGIDRNRILIDPGFGFGKTLEQNLTLMRHLDRFVDTGLPVLVGVSRKRMIGEITGRDLQNRDAGSVAMAQIALEKGARIIRAHDVASTCDMIRIYKSLTDK